VSNLGVSAIVTPWGDVRRDVGSSGEGIVSARVRSESEQTVYTRYGDTFAWLCVLIVVVDVGLAALRRNRGERPGREAPRPHLTRRRP